MNNETLISNDKLILQLFEVFTCGFKSLLNSARDDELETLVKICPSLFRKWLFSALIEDTPLTPANIFLNLSGRAESFSVKTSLDKSGFVCTLCTAEDTLENSVFLSDLKALCLRCTPVGEYDFFSSETAYDFCGKFPELKLQDGYYVSYLAIIAQRLGLIAKMPAINTVKYQTGQYCTEFFSMSAKKQHDIILKEAISIFIEKTALQMQAPLTAADIPHIISILTESCITDSIFEYIYSSMGFDFEKIADIGQNPVLSEEDEALVSSVLYLGILIDKWLIAPLGYYMGLLSPAYSSPYCFAEDFDYIRPVLATGCDLSVELFSPSNYYVLTEKGSCVLGGVQSDSESYTIKGKMTGHDLNEIIQAYNMFTSMINSSVRKKSMTGDIYSLKISFKNDSDMWKIIEIPANSTLSELKDEINMYFGFSGSPKYCFDYNGRSFKAPKKLGNLNSAENITLASLGLSDGSVLTFTDGLDRCLDLRIVSSEAVPAEKNAIYPRLFRQSRRITERERSDEF